MVKYSISDLNEDSLSFLDPASFVRLENLGNEPLLHSSMLFSFRTKQKSALVFYMYDEFNNFLQLEVRGEDLAGILFNDGTTLLEVNITVPGEYLKIVLNFIKLHCIY